MNGTDRTKWEIASSRPQCHMVKLNRIDTEDLGKLWNIPYLSVMLIVFSIFFLTSCLIRGKLGPLAEGGVIIN